MSSLTLSFVDDHPLLREGTAAIFRSRRGFEVKSMGACAAEAVSIAREGRPDILCLDLNIPGDAIAAIRTIAEECSDTKVVVFTASESPDHAFAALNAGARGYVLKGSTVDELASAFALAHQGDIYITPGFAAKAIYALQRKHTTAPRQSVVSPLSHREDQIVRMLLRGKKNKEIASELHLSEKTVKSYMTNLMQKFNARSRLEVVIAVQQQPDMLRDSAAAASRAPMVQVG